MNEKEDFKKNILARTHSTSSFDDMQLRNITEYLIAIKGMVNDVRKEMSNEKQDTESLITDYIETQVQALYKRYHEYVAESEEKYQQKLKNIRLSCRQQMQDALIMLKTDFEKENNKQKTRSVDKKEKIFLIKRVKHLEQCMGEYETMLDGCNMPIIFDSKKDPYHFSSDDIDFDLEDLNDNEPIESINLRIKVNRVQQDLVREKIKSKQLITEIQARNKVLSNYIKENDRLRADKMGKSVEQSRDSALRLKTVKDEYIIELQQLKQKISELKQSLNEQRMLAQTNARKAAAAATAAAAAAAAAPKDDSLYPDRGRDLLDSGEDLIEADRTPEEPEDYDWRIAAKNLKDDQKNADTRKAARRFKDDRTNTDRKKAAKRFRDIPMDADAKKAVRGPKDEQMDTDTRKGASNNKNGRLNADRKKATFDVKTTRTNAERRIPVVIPKDDNMDLDRISIKTTEEYSDLESMKSAMSYKVSDSDSSRSVSRSRDVSDVIIGSRRDDRAQSLVTARKEKEETSLIKSLPTFEATEMEMKDASLMSCTSILKPTKEESSGTETGSAASLKAREMETKFTDMKEIDTISKDEDSKSMPKEIHGMKKDIIDMSEIYKGPKKRIPDTEMTPRYSLYKSVTEELFYTDMSKLCEAHKKDIQDTEMSKVYRAPKKDIPDTEMTSKSELATSFKESYTDTKHKSSCPRCVQDMIPMDTRRSSTPKSDKEEIMERLAQSSHFLTVSAYMKTKSSTKDIKEKLTDSDMGKHLRISREYSASDEVQTCDQCERDAREYFSQIDVKHQTAPPPKEFLSETQMDKFTKPVPDKVIIASSPLLQCRTIETQKRTPVKQISPKKTEFTEKEPRELMTIQLHNLHLQKHNLHLQKEMEKLAEYNKELLRKIRVLEQSRMIEPRKKFKILKDFTLSDKPETGQKNNFYKKKIQILQQSHNVLRNEMFMRQNLQRQSCLMHHAGITYKMSANAPAKDQPLQVKLCSTDIASYRDGNVLPSAHYEVPLRNSFTNYEVPFPSFEELSVSEA